MISKLLVAFLLIAGGKGLDSPVVTTPLGKVSGYIKQSFEGRDVAAFEGIPFAKPPVGELRFSDPEPIDKWAGTWQATKTHLCIQKDMYSPRMAGQEDCLYLNVYVPNHLLNSDKKLDVVIHIHGGGFMAGSGHFYVQPDFLLDRDLILVTFNYRLGILGFLSTEDSAASGNYGLKDQTLALKWVKDNIASFGGNPESITLTGLSAGGASSHFHYLSPLSKGLFHRGISQSGTAINIWALQKKASEKAKKLGNLLGCQTSDNSKLIECLRQRPAESIVGQTSQFQNELNQPLVPFAPVIDKASSKNPFLPKHPYMALLQKEVYDVPWISSMTTEEGFLPAMYFVNKMDVIEENWEQWAPLFLDFNFTSAKSQWPSLAREIKEFYLGKDGKFSESTIYDFVKMCTDRLFSVDIESATKLQARATSSPVYSYVYGYKLKTENRTPFFSTNLDGVGHGFDINTMYFPANATEHNPADLEVKNAFIDMIASYAKTGIPKFPGTEWEPSEHSEYKYIKIEADGRMGMKSTKQYAPRQFWKDLGLHENQNIILMKDEL